VKQTRVWVAGERAAPEAVLVGAELVAVDEPRLDQALLVDGASAYLIPAVSEGVRGKETS
jgi:hypothetical protein